MIELAAGPDGRCRSADASFGWAAQAGRGKSELHRAVCRITSGGRPLRAVNGKCHREDTAPPIRFTRADLAGVAETGGVRVKRCGKSAPRRQQWGWQGKPHTEQDQIGEDVLRDGVPARRATTSG